MLEILPAFHGFEDEGRGHEPRNAGSLQLEKARKQILSCSFQKGMQIPTSWFQPSETYARLPGTEAVKVIHLSSS